MMQLSMQVPPTNEEQEEMMPQAPRLRRCGYCLLLVRPISLMLHNDYTVVGLRINCLHVCLFSCLAFAAYN